MRKTGYASRHITSNGQHADSCKAQFPITALREIKLLKMLSHSNILQLVEMAIERPVGEAPITSIGASRTDKDDSG